MSDDLVAFVRARLDEDWLVASASAATGAGSDWTSDGFDVSGASRAVASCTSTGAATRFAADAAHGHVVPEHIARHDPARVLLEVEAKRRIVDRYLAGDSDMGRAHGGPVWNEPESQALGEDVLRLLAAVWSDHPDYRPEWSVHPSG